MATGNQKSSLMGILNRNDRKTLLGQDSQPVYDGSCEGAGKEEQDRASVVAGRDVEPACAIGSSPLARASP